MAAQPQAFIENQALVIRRATPSVLAWCAKFPSLARLTAGDDGARCGQHRVGASASGPRASSSECPRLAFLALG
jgi:hypothetical protein